MLIHWFDNRTEKSFAMDIFSLSNLNSFDKIFFFSQGSTLTFVTSGLLAGKMVLISQRTLSTSYKNIFS